MGYCSSGGKKPEVKPKPKPAYLLRNFFRSSWTVVCVQDSQCDM